VEGQRGTEDPQGLTGEGSSCILEGVGLGQGDTGVVFFGEVLTVGSFKRPGIRGQSENAKGCELGSSTAGSFILHRGIKTPTIGLGG